MKNDLDGYSTIAIERPERGLFWVNNKFKKELDAAVESALKLGIRMYINGLIVDGLDQKVLRIHVPSAYLKDEKAIEKLKDHTKKYTKEWMANIAEAA